MNKWRGLANEGLHDPNEETAGKTAWCQCCGAIDCRPAAPCWCCEVYRAEAEVERLTAELADRDRRIEEALAFLHHPTEVNGCTCLAHQIAATLRGAPCCVDVIEGESDE